MCVSVKADTKFQSCILKVWEQTGICDRLIKVPLSLGPKSLMKLLRWLSYMTKDIRAIRERILLSLSSDVNLVWNLGGRGSGSTKFRFFQANFREILIVPGKFLKSRFFQANFQKISIFLENFTNNFDFQAKIAHLHLLLGNLFYFSSKVTTFEHTCRLLLVHDKI